MAGSHRKKKKWKKLLMGAVVLAAGGSAAYIYLSPESTETIPVNVSYKEEKVKYGSVVSGITESGSVTFGSSEQTFSLQALIDTAGSSSEESSSSAVGSNGGSQSMNAGGSMNMGNSMDMGSGMGGSMNTSSSSANSTSVTTGLKVEEIYLAAGQQAAVGDPVLKLTEESIEEYRSELEDAVTSAELAVTQEEINVESRRAEADYTYEMYLAKGKTAKETYDATITSLENKVTDLEEELAESADLIAEYEAELEAGYDVEEELEEEELNYSTIEANLRIANNNLITQSIEAKQIYENAMTNYRYAEQLYAIDTNGLEDDLNDAKDTLADAQKALATFNEQIGEGIVFAEYAGKVSEVVCAEGDTLTDGSSLVTFADADDVTMTAAVTQDDISMISIGDVVSIELDAYKDETFEGEVTSIETAASMGSSTVNYNVTVRFTGDITRVYSGMTGEVTFVVKAEEDTLYISNKAVHQDGTRTWVKVKEENGNVQEVDIETGFSNGSSAAVLSGLKEGQVVLIESQVTE